MDRARILLVEDDEDTRALLVLALEAEGFQVDQATDPSSALRCLRAHRYALVLTDYDLPGQTGASMLRQAAAAGLLRGTPTLVVTAHPDPQGVDPRKVMLKPLDLDKFIRQVHRLSRSEAGTPPAPDQGTEDRPEVVELVLHVSAASPASVKAQRNVTSALERYPGTRIRLSVVNVADDPRAAEEDRVLFTPTLVKRRPEPPLWMLGDLGDPDVVADLLHTCGVEPVR